MKNPYEEVFNFFSQPKNLENMFKVAGHFPKVKSMLQAQFWQSVEGKLRELGSANHKSWTTTVTGNILIGNTKLLIYKPSWLKEETLPPVAIGFEWLALDSNSPFYGLWVNRNSTTIDYLRIISHINQLEIKKRFPKGFSEWWPLWESTDINYQNLDTLIKLLPENRSLLVESLANTVFDLANEIETELDAMSGMVKQYQMN